MSRLLMLLPLLLASLALPVEANERKSSAKGSSGKEAGGYLYRYRNDKGVLVIDSFIPPEYARKGYQLVTRSGQVVQDVPPAAVDEALDEDENRRRREQEAQMSRRDTELRKLYSSPADAVRLRDRQVDAINLKIDFARGQILQLTS